MVREMSSFEDYSPGNRHGISLRTAFCESKVNAYFVCFMYKQWTPKQ